MSGVIALAPAFLSLFLHDMLAAQAAATGKGRR